MSPPTRAAADPTIEYLGFLSLDQVGSIENRSPFAISPLLFVAVVVLLVVLCLRYARTRAGWPLAVALSIVAPISVEASASRPR